MEALWNRMDLGHPPNNAWQASVDEFDVTGFVKAIENVIQDLESQDILHMEAAILSRLIYRMKRKFRTDKGLKNMEKVNRALLNYLELTLHKEYRSLKDCIEIDGDYVHLPTRQMLQYVLVRTQGFAKLMCRIEDVASCAGNFFKARMNIGHAWTISVIAYAVISRIWVISKYLIKRCCVWYNSVYQYLNKLKPIGIAWLPDKYNLPRNLKMWLNVPWIDEEMKSVSIKDHRLDKESIFGLISVQNDDSQEALKFNTEEVDGVPGQTTQLIDISEDKYSRSERVSKIKDEFSKSVGSNCFLVDDDDVGKSIDREMFKLNLDSEKSPVFSKDKLKRLKSKEPKSPKNNDATIQKKKKNTAVASDESVSEVYIPNTEKTEAKSSSKKRMSIIDSQPGPNNIDIEVRKRKLNTSKKTSLTPSKKKKGQILNKSIAEVDQSKNENVIEKSVILDKSGLAPSKEKEKRRMEISESHIRTNAAKPKITTETYPVKDEFSTLMPADEGRKYGLVANMKTKRDLIRFISADSYPGLDRLQWKMLSATVKKFVSKLDNCDSTDKLNQARLLRKVNRLIRISTKECHPSS